ncbi:hypothetical protein BST47_15390 [Mycolicibacterium tusciae]|uniref:Uncharacterized protein n=1 Tax=Mycolicibacterium tusciae TaxID=75922 RepID=A0A1X0JP42_9MYCO|nr:hypothetical protein BST47_15390 [Mycolicibacterium tusciae]
MWDTFWHFLWSAIIIFAFIAYLGGGRFIHAFVIFVTVPRNVLEFQQCWVRVLAIVCQARLSRARGEVALTRAHLVWCHHHGSEAP